MGYSHYWNETPFSDKQWARVKLLAQRIIDSSDVPVQFEDDVSDPPEISDERIRFNGVGEDGHETFLVSKNGTGRGFCKTARNPYDEIVVAILMMLHGVNKKFTWSSDGDSSEHADGKKLFLSNMN